MLGRVVTELKLSSPPIDQETPRHSLTKFNKEVAFAPNPAVTESPTAATILTSEGRSWWTDVGTDGEGSTEQGNEIVEGVDVINKGLEESLNSGCEEMNA
jgi:hypothetical protein